MSAISRHLINPEANGVGQAWRYTSRGGRSANAVAVKGFRDITLGTNGGCVARAGYDYCTGIGSLQSAALSGAL